MSHDSGILNCRRFTCLVVLLLVFTAPPTDAQEAPPPRRLSVENGVMVWDNGEEAALWGVNYYTPFSQTFRAMNYLGKDHREAIDEDVYHIARLGLDAYRVHLYEIEVTDSLGNLLENQHLDLLDYLFHKLEQRGIKIIITPTTYYNSAWPDGNVVEPPGFASYITKGEAPRVPEYRPVIKNYLAQLINHRNPYTGMSYARDPNIIGLEIDNEPSHSSDVDHTREFVNELAGHLRENGWDKPIFYNISHNFGVTDAFLDAEIDGVTYQWYPAGLYEGMTKRSNYFPYVNSFPVPWGDDPRYANMARIAYEFSPADAMHNYAFPMMARGFREAGLQFAAQFAYTALAIGHINTDWRSHYLNLVYTPRKAVAMLIGTEVFDAVGRGEQFADYPADTVFGDFTVSHHKELSLYNAPDAFLYSNTTDAEPVREPSLERVAGVGSSPIVSYPGTGAYFLDRLDTGVWRLEILPDVIHVRDPFEPPAFDKHVAYVEWHDYPMTISLADLGTSFSIRGVNEGNTFRGGAEGGTFTAAPGAYVLTREGVDGSRWTPDRQYRNLLVGEYHAVPPNSTEPVVWHRPFTSTVAGQPLTVTANVAGLSEGDQVALVVQPLSGRPQRIPMTETEAHRYAAEIPGEGVSTGILRYYIVVNRNGGSDFVTFPGANPSAPGRWDFYSGDEQWTTEVVEPGAPLELWDAADDYETTFQAFGGWGGGGTSSLVSTDRPNSVARSVSSTRGTEGRHVLGFGTYVRDRVAGIPSSALGNYDHLVVRARTDFDNPAPLKVVLVDDDGNSFSATVPVTGTWQSHAIALSDFEPDRFMLLPRGFPGTLPAWYATGEPGPVEPEKIEEIQFYIDTSDSADYAGDPYGFAIESAWLNR